MRLNKSNILLDLDWGIILLYIILVVMGWFSIYATTHSEGQELFDLTTHYGKQLLFIGLSFGLIILILSIEANFYERFTSVFYLISLVILLGLFLFGKTINGQTAWYSFGSFSLQPAEFVKSTTALAIAKILSDNLFDIKKIRDFKNVLIILFFPFILILFQPDFGSAIIYFAFIFVLLREGLSIQFFGSLVTMVFMFISTIKYGVNATLIIILLFLSLFYYYAYKRQNLFFRRNWPYVIGSVFLVLILVFGSNFLHKRVLKPHHKDRIALWLRMENDKKKIKKLKRTYGFNNDQSIKTIASGGAFGKGFLEGDRTNGKFVPEQHTDYIFSTIGEEFGFIGSSIVIVLFTLLIILIIYRAEQQKSKFSRIYGYSVASIIFVHFVINIGMVLDLLPTVGIPLPFFSYGGSSLWGFTILIFIFIKLDSNQSNVL
jgi:rod shape determining protein RodA